MFNAEDEEEILHSQYEEGNTEPIGELSLKVGQK
jgi:hypothetical protein